MPRVTVGVPVRNGGATLRRALDSLVNQTHAELTILISDNCSTDDTPAIIEEFARRDPRIRSVTQTRPLTATENFRAVFDLADTEYFMWAAHDDYRNEAYVAALIAALEADPTAVLAHGNTVLFTEGADVDAIEPFVYQVDWEGLSRYRRLASVLGNKCPVMYGMLRARCLRAYSWVQTEYGSDLPLLLYLRSQGRFVHVPGATIYERIDEGQNKTMRQRARNESLRDLRAFPLVRTAWACGTGSAEAASLVGERPRRLADAALSYAVLKQASVKLWLYPRLPEPVKRLRQRGRALAYSRRPTSRAGAPT